MTALDYATREEGRSGRAAGEPGRGRSVAAALACAAALGLAVAFFGLALTPDLFVLIGLAPALVLRRERSYLTELLRVHHGNLAQAARAAGMDRKNLWALVARHGLDRATFKKV